MAFGYHLMLDLYGCNPEFTGNLEKCYKFLDELPTKIGMHKQSPPFIFYTDNEKYPDKAGLSGWVPVVESGISIHTLTPTNFISIDVYSCKKFDPKIIEKTIRDFFQPQEMEINYVLRGKRYEKKYAKILKGFKK